MTCHAHVAVLAGYRKALVGTGWAISLPFSTNGCRNCSSAFFRGSISVIVGIFSQEKRLLVGEP